MKIFDEPSETYRASTTIEGKTGEGHYIRASASARAAFDKAHLAAGRVKIYYELPNGRRGFRWA